MKNELVSFKNIFDPLLPYIHLISITMYEVNVRIVIPPKLKLDVELIKHFFIAPTIEEGTMGQRTLYGCIKGYQFQSYILKNYYEGNLGKISYSFTLPTPNDL